VDKPNRGVPSGAGEEAEPTRDENSPPYEVEPVSAGFFARGPSPRKMDDLLRERSGTAWRVTHLIAQHGPPFLKRKTHLLLFEPQEEAFDAPEASSGLRNERTGPN
jgi:hypothetical protein